MRILFIGIPVLVVIIVLIAPLFRHASICGGNCAALSYVGEAAKIIQLKHIRNPRLLPVAAAAFLQDEDLRNALGFDWGVQSYWLKKEIHRQDVRPIIICAQIFSDHDFPGCAAGFIDGTKRVLPISEFNTIDFSKYIYVDAERVTQYQKRK